MKRDKAACFIQFACIKSCSRSSDRPQTCEQENHYLLEFVWGYLITVPKTFKLNVQFVLWQLLKVMVVTQSLKLSFNCNERVMW